MSAKKPLSHALRTKYTTLVHSSPRPSTRRFFTPTPRTMANPTSPNSNVQVTGTGTTESQESSTPPLPLPEPSNSDDTTKIDMSTGGSTVKLDHMGPLVVNKDGTLSRIANWDSMAEIERQNTLRILGKRNMLRREGLEKAAAEKEGGEGK
ncbi:hypothetical protein NX059_004450 [Plenodomus lindquistii]|nr:hypothetical protein NX059_004450 [Plenodomus lindquistii]